MDWNFEEAVVKMTERRSVRNFSNQTISDDVLNHILQAGLHTASGGNLQPFSILVERDPARNQMLGKMLHYSFVSAANVNLLFVLDWYKLYRYSRCRKAPFVENYSTSHFFIAWDDTILSAQAVETAAWLCGVGSCFVGHVMDCTEELRDLYNLPDFTFPVILLSMGYPKILPRKASKLNKNMMVFEGKYPGLTDDEICAAFDEKYANKQLPMPSQSRALEERLTVFRRALTRSFSEQECERIIAQALEKGYLTEIQRLFGIHYHPDRELGDSITQKLHNQKLYPFSTESERK